MKLCVHVAVGNPVLIVQPVIVAPAKKDWACRSWLIVLLDGIQWNEDELMSIRFLYVSMFIDVRVFNPLAATHKHQPISTYYRKQERAKKRRAYEEQRVKDAQQVTFTPLVFSATGSMTTESIKGSSFSIF